MWLSSKIIIIQNNLVSPVKGAVDAVDALILTWQNLAEDLSKSIQT